MKIFIAFGKNEKVKDDVAAFLRSLNVETIVLEDMANNGSTVIEKLEKVNAEKAVIILTGDDKIIPFKSHYQNKYPRQNVIFEYGYFMAKLGRNNVICVAKDRRCLSLLSDVDGVVYIQYKANDKKWKKEIQNEIFN